MVNASEGKMLVGAWRTRGGARARAGLGALVETAGLAPGVWGQLLDLHGASSNASNWTTTTSPGRHGAGARG